MLAALGSGALLGGAYYFQYVVGLVARARCASGSASRTWWRSWSACWRSPPSPAAGSRWSSSLTAILALFATAGIGVFHVGVEYHWWEGPQACTGDVPRGLSPEELKKYLFGAKMVRCDEIAWAMWGISMAGWNAILSGDARLRARFGVASWVRERR